MDTKDLSPTSTFVLPSVLEDVQPHFTDFTPLSTNGAVTLLVKAKRYGRWWVLKGLQPAYREQSIYQELLKKEYAVMAGLGNHPSIVAVHSLEQVDEVGWCIVMEWIEGVTLAHWLQGKHTKEERRHIAHLLIDALAYIHSQQTEHRDLKSQNIMLIQDGKYLKLIDFGLGDTANYAILKEPAGTQGYMAPDGPSDIYALGCVLDELHLGLMARLVVNRCKAPQHKRYDSVEAVRRALQRNQRILHGIGIIVATAATIVLTLLLATKNAETLVSQERQSAHDSISVLHQQQHIQVQQNREITDSFHHRINELEDEKETATQHQQLVHECINNGKKQIDTNIQNLGTDTFMDTVSTQIQIGNVLEQAIMKQIQFINDYTQSLPTEITEAERTTISTSLLQYLENKYTFKWRDREAHLPPI